MSTYIMHLCCLEKKTELTLVLPDFVAGMLIAASILVMVSMLTVFIIVITLRRDLICVTVEQVADESVPEEEAKTVESSLASVAEVPTAVVGIAL